MLSSILRSLRYRLLGELSAEEVVEACERNYLHYWECVGQSPNAEFSQSKGITQCITGLPQEMFNVVIRCVLNPAEINARIDEAIAYFRSRKIPLIWHVGSLTEPKDLGRHLEAHGFPHDYDLTAMAIDLDRASSHIKAPEGVIVKSVADREDSKHWIECLTESWESPSEVAPWMLNNVCFNTSIELEGRKPLPRKMYLGQLHGRPVGASMLVWDEDIAGLQAVGTVRSARGKGIGTAVVTAALRDARTMGFKFVVVLSTVEGLDLYRKNGFRAFGKLPEHSMHFEDLSL